MANAQAQANVTAAQQTAALNRVNQITPQGTLTYSGPASGNINDPWTVTQQYSPAEQALYQQQLQGQNIYAGTALSELGQASGALGTPINTNPAAYQASLFGQMPGLPGAAGASATPINTNYGGLLGGTYGMMAGLPNATAAAATPINTNYGSMLGGAYGSMAGLGNAAAAAAQPTDTNFSDVRNQYIGSQMGLLQPELAMQQQTLESKLANQGVAQGSPAYNNAMRDFGNQQQAAYANILANAQTGVGQAIQQQGALQMQPIQAAAGFGQLLGQGAGLAGTNIQNQAQLAGTPIQLASNFAQLLGQGQGLAGSTIQNQAALAGTPINLAAQYANLYGGLQNIQGAQIQQQAALRDQPLNEANALLTGQMVQNPQFSNVPGVNVAAAPVYNATQLALQQQDFNYQQQMANYSGMMGGIGSLAGMGLGAAMMGPYGAMAGAQVGKSLGNTSDERLKTDIRKVGSLDLPGGSVGIHSFRFHGSPVRQLGLLAQDVEPVMPGAVQTHPLTGIKSLDYAHVLSQAHFGGQPPPRNGSMQNGR